MGSSTAFVQSGKLRALAVTSAERSKLLPDVPTMIESGFPELDLGSWQGVYVPRGTPKAIVDRLYKVTVKVVHDPWTREQYSKALAMTRDPAQQQRISGILAGLK